MTTLLDLMGVPPIVASKKKDKPKKTGGIAYRQGDIVSFVKLDGPVEAALACCRTRLMVVGGMFLLAFMVVSARLFDVMVLNQEKPKLASAGHGPLNVVRADIIDREGALLATNLTSDSVFAQTQQIKDPEAVAQQLMQIFPDLNHAKLEAQLAKEEKFIWIKRNITPEQKYAVNEMGEPGLQFEEQQQRVYPHGNLLAHALGYVNIDNVGLSGLEKTLDDRLTYTEGSGEPLQLSIDLRVQHVVHDAIKTGMLKHDAKAAVGLVTDIHSGEILSLVSMPDFDPHHPTASGDQARFNRAALGVYEMGSTFKTLTMAMALDAGNVRITDQFDTTKPVKLARYTFRDHHPSKHWMSLPEVFAKSSNVGTVQIAKAVGKKGQQAFLSKLGMMEPVSLELPEIGVPQLPSRWGDVHMFTVSFGYGMSVSPLHMAQSIGALTNGGIKKPLTMVRRQPGEEVEGTRVIKEHTSQQMRALMRQVVAGGTGKRAEVKGYMVGGKTGTAEKNAAGGYNRKALISSFVAVFPIHDPKYLVMVMYDEPSKGEAAWGRATASTTAAPTAGEIVGRIGPLLNVQPVGDVAGLDDALRKQIHYTPRKKPKASAHGTF